MGLNSSGELGDNSTTNRSTPVSLSAPAIGSKSRYTYDGDGLRVSKTVGGTSTAFTWDSTRSVPLLLVEGDTSYVYGPDGLVLEEITASVPLFHHHDQIGSTRTLTDKAGAVVGTFTYDAYGSLKASTGSAKTSFGYAGEYTDVDTALVYLRARFYDPKTGQFLTRDPLVGETREAYGYVGGNPLNFTDPMGHNKCEIGANPLRWGGNIQDCGSDAARSDLAQSAKTPLAVVGTAAGVVALGALAVGTAPVSVPVAVVGGIATGATAAYTAIECGDGGPGGPCAAGVASTALAGGSRQAKGVGEIGASRALSGAGNGLGTILALNDLSDPC